MPNKAGLPHLLKLLVCIVAAAQRLGISDSKNESKKSVWCLCVCPADLISFSYYAMHDIIWFLSLLPLFSLSSIFPLVFSLSPFLSHVRCYVTMLRQPGWDCEPLHHTEKTVPPFHPWPQLLCFTDCQSHTINPRASALLLVCLGEETKQPKMVVTNSQQLM